MLKGNRFHQPIVDSTHVNAQGLTAGRVIRLFIVWAAVLAALLTAALIGCQPTPATSTPAATPIPLTATPLPSSAQETLAEFYNWYTTFPGDPLQEGRYSNNEILRPYLTSEVIDKINDTLALFDTPSGYDPFLCARDTTGDFTFETISAEADTAQIAVRRTIEGDLSPTGMIVNMVYPQSRWQIMDVTCHTFSTDTDTTVTAADDAETKASALEVDWATYHSEEYGFRIRYPASWEPSPEIPTDTRGEDPIAAYIVFREDNSPTPVALVVSIGPLEAFRLLFPTPVAGGEQFTSGNNTVLYEQHFGGEQYYVLPHPLRDDLRVALRVVDHSGTAGPELDESVDRMLESFSYDDVSSVERGARP